jgi:hypothetical protein
MIFLCFETFILAIGLLMSTDLLLLLSSGAQPRYPGGYFKERFREGLQVSQPCGCKPDDMFTRANYIIRQ